MTLCCDVPGHPPMQQGWHVATSRLLEIGDFQLESGQSIIDCKLSWVMHGHLNPTASNAVLMLCAIGSSHHRLDFLVGPGAALDSSRYCVICVDALGNGLSSSPSNSTSQPYLQFPRFTVRDMVHSQHLLQQHLGIQQWHAVLGASMGGMQALQWAVSFPHAMRAVVAMTPMARTHPWAAAVNAAARGAITADPNWAEPGHRSAGLAGWVPMVQLLSARTPDSIGNEFDGSGSVLEWIERRTSVALEHGPVPVDWVWQSHAYDAHDVGTTEGFGGDTQAALQSIRARTLVLAPPLDLYNPAPAARAAARDIPGCRFVEIPSDRGHHAAGAWSAVDAGWVNAAVKDFLDIES